MDAAWARFFTNTIDEPVLPIAMLQMRVAFVHGYSAALVAATEAMCLSDTLAETMDRLDKIVLDVRTRSGPFIEGK